MAVVDVVWVTYAGPRWRAVASRTGYTSARMTEAQPLTPDWISPPDGGLRGSAGGARLRRETPGTWFRSTRDQLSLRPQGVSATGRCRRAQSGLQEVVWNHYLVSDARRFCDTELSHKTRGWAERAPVYYATRRCRTRRYEPTGVGSRNDSNQTTSSDLTASAAGHYATGAVADSRVIPFSR